jgi:cell division protein FtsQ
MKYIKKIVIWVLTCLYLLLIAGFVSTRYESQLCNEIRITIEDSLNSGFLSQEDILQILDKKGIQCLGRPLADIDLSYIEDQALTNQIVRQCRAYTGTNGVLYIDVSQREPFVRIIDRKGQGYYIDREGNVLSLSSRFTPHVLVVNGNINTPFKIGEAVNVNTLDENNAGNTVRDIYMLTRFITQHDLWNSQIVQIYVTKTGEFELVPRVGPHLILLGTADNYEEKLENLEIFYREGLNNIGWNHYLKINLTYKDQVVCTKI